MQILLAALTIALGGAACRFWLRSRRLARALAEARASIDELAALLALEHDTNYRLACRMYGAAVVDHAIRVANTRGVS